MNKEYLIAQKVGDRGTSKYSVKPYAFTIPTNPMSNRGQLVLERGTELRIRKLTPKECFRLMGFAGGDPNSFDDTPFERAESVASNTRLYKAAGNSIVVQCLEEIFGKVKETGVWDE